MYIKEYIVKRKEKERYRDAYRERYFGWEV
jgi:hypothetical protein